MVLWTFSLAIGGIRLSLATEHKNKVQPPRRSPLWQLDVRALGWAEFTTHWEPGRGSPSASTLRYACFPTQDMMIVTFVTREAPTGLPRRGQTEASLPFRLHALFIDAKEGRLRATRQWPTASEWSEIAPAPKGKFVVITPDELMLYSPEVEPLRQLPLHLTAEASKHHWSIRPSPPGGRYMIVAYGSNEPRTGDFVVRRQLVDTESLRVIRAWTEKKTIYNGWSISDDGTVLAGEEIGTLDGPFRWLCQGRRDVGQPSLPPPYCSFLSLVNNQVVFAMGYSWREMALMSTSGDVLMDRQDFFPAREVLDLWAPWAASPSGERLAITVDKLKGGSAVLDIGPTVSLSRVSVYDIPARQWIYSLDGKKQGAKRISAIALSPDGSLLAWINQDGILELYRVPGRSEQPGVGSVSARGGRRHCCVDVSDDAAVAGPQSW